MIVKKKINASPKEFFDVLEESIKSEMKDARVIKKGMKYTKKVSNNIGYNGKVRVSVLEYIRLLQYKSMVTNENGESSIIEFEVKDYSEDKNLLEIEYKEGFYSEKIIQKINNKIVMIFLKKSMKKRMMTKLDILEKQIESKRGVKCQD